MVKYPERCMGCPTLDGSMGNYLISGSTTTSYHMPQPLDLSSYCSMAIRLTLPHLLLGKQQVVVFCLPPHTTHETQPLDKGPFSPLKSYWREACRQFLHDNPGKVISRFTFSKVFGKVWGKVVCMENIISGFRCTGLYPVDRNKLIVKNEMPKKSTLAECTRVNFIPLFSPRRRSTVNDTMFTPDEHIIY